MVDFLNSWVQGIVVAIVIATVIEMLVPEGNNKKYVKMVIGLYILFTIVSPVIHKLGKKEIDFTNSIDLQKYEKEAKKYSVNSNSLEESNEKNIQTIYENNLKSDMKNKLEEKGYVVEKIELEIPLEGEYRIENISVKLQKKKEEKSTKQIEMVNKIQVNTVQVEIAKNEETEQEKKEAILEKKEIQKIKEYLSNLYQIQEKNIRINE